MDRIPKPLKTLCGVVGMAMFWAGAVVPVLVPTLPADSGMSFFVGGMMLMAMAVAPDAAEGFAGLPTRGEQSSEPNIGRDPIAEARERYVEGETDEVEMERELEAALNKEES